MYGYIAREHADRPVRLDADVARVIAHDDQLARGDRLSEQGSVRYPPMAPRWSRLSESGQRPNDIPLDLADDHPLQVEHRLHGAGDAVDDVLGHRTGKLPRKRLEPAALLDDPRVAKRDRGVRSETLKCGAVVGVERTGFEAADREGRSELAVEKDRYADQHAHSDVADRWYGGQVRRVIVDRYRRAGPEDSADDPHPGRRMYPNDLLACAGSCRDVELVPATHVDGRVLRVREKECASSDRAEERHRLGLRRDLGSKALEALAETKRFVGARLLGPIAIDRRGEDQDRDRHHDDLGEELRYRGGLLRGHAHQFHAETRREVRPHRGKQSHTAEAIHGEGADGEDDDEGDAPRICRAADHPDPRGHEIGDDDVYRDLVQAEGATSLSIEPPDTSPCRDEENERSFGDRDDPLPAECEPGDATQARAQTTE